MHTVYFKWINFNVISTIPLYEVTSVIYISWNIVPWFNKGSPERNLNWIIEFVYTSAVEKSINESYKINSLFLLYFSLSLTIPQKTQFLYLRDLYLLKLAFITLNDCLFTTFFQILSSVKGESQSYYLLLCI